MKKVVLKESDLISLIKKIIKEREEEVETIYFIIGIPIKKPGKPMKGKMVWGNYKDGSTLFIPYGEHSKYNSKIKFYDNEIKAKKDAMWLRKSFPDMEIIIEPITRKVWK